MSQASERSTDRRLATLFVWAAGLTLLLWFFPPVTHVLLLLLAAASIAAALAPIQRHLPGRLWARGALVGTAFWILIAVLAFLMAWQLKAPIQRQIEQWPRIEQSLNQSLGRAGDWLGLHQPLTVESLTSQAAQWLLAGDGGEAFATVADGVTGVVLALLMLIFGSIFLLATSPEDLVGPIVARLPTARARHARDSLASLEPKLRWWLLGTLLSMVVSAVATYAGLAVIGMPFALPVALIMGLSQIVPTLGPSAATILALLLAAPQGPATFLAVAIWLAIVMTVESNVITPLIMKRAVRVSPVVSLFTVVLWARLLGPLGMLLAIPIDLVLWSFFIHFVPTRGETATGADTR